MKYDYKKLTEDLKRATEAGEIAARGEDGGTANLDTVTLSLPSANEKKLLRQLGQADYIQEVNVNGLGQDTLLMSPEGKAIPM